MEVRLLNDFLVKETLEKNYEIKVIKMEKIKNVFKLYCTSGIYCFKTIRYELGHFLFILGAMKHLQNNGFKTIPKIIPSCSKNEYIAIGSYYGYLMPWVNGRQCCYENPIDLMLAATKLAELHEKSKKFYVNSFMTPRTEWFKWISTFNTRINEILNFKNIIDEKKENTEFDYVYKNAIKTQLSIAESAVSNLNETEYIMKMNEEIKYKGFCHHDYAHHNILIDSKVNVNIIDFDYCILDSHLHDISSLLIRTMKNGKWSMDKALYVLDAYNTINKIQKDDVPIMAAFMEFPQDYWQIGIQYYWENKPYGEEYFLNKLNKILLDTEDKKDFVEEFRYLVYKGY